MKRIIGSMAGVLVVAAICVCVILLSSGPAPALAVSVRADDAAITKRGGKITRVDVNIYGRATWDNFDGVPEATLDLYFKRADDTSYYQVKSVMIHDDIGTNAASGFDTFEAEAIDLTDSFTFITAPGWANDVAFSAPADGTTRVNDMMMKVVVKLSDGETTITKSSSDTFKVTVKSIEASVDFTATAVVSIC